MKRLLLLVIAAALAAVVISLALRSGQRGSSAAVFAILPREMLAVAILPDVNAARAEWRRTDLYAIWLEPAVQEFLRKPREKLPKAAGVREVFDELERLGATNAFIGVTAANANGSKIIGGFRLNRNAPDAEKVLDSWRTRLLAGAGKADRITSDHGKHRIETIASGIQRVSTCAAGDWFLAANDLEELKGMLDKVDDHAKASSANLATDELFAAASRQMPKSYAALVYGRPDRLAALLPATAGAGGGVVAALAEVHGFTGAVWFEAGKIHDRTFVTMPKKIEGSLGRTSMALGTKDTFLYFSALADLSTMLLNRDASNGAAGFAKPLAVALTSSGITPADWNAAFAAELSIVGDWTQDSRLPSVVAAVPVKDAARARKLSASFPEAEGGGLTTRQKEGVTYFTAQSTGQLFSLSPTLAISDRLLAVGFDLGSVEMAMARASAGGAGLAAVPDFQAAQSLVPASQGSFAYVDPALLYRRFDAAVRPMLLMGAAFVPGINDNVDLSKFPEPEAITKHLSPIAMSQRYVDGGYLADSAGPVTMNGLFAGVAALAGGGFTLYQQQLHGSGGWSGRSFFVPRATAAPSATPSP